MNVHVFIPLIACIAYLPLLAGVISNWPWSRQRRLFFLFLFSIFIFSIINYLFFSDLLPKYSIQLIDISCIVMIWAAVQFHFFISSYFPDDKRRWLAIAFGALILDIVLFALDYLPGSYINIGGRLYPQFGISILIIILPGLVLLARNVYILIPRLRNQGNPLVYAQTAFLLIAVAIFTIVVMIALLPTCREIPILNLGNLAVAAILSFSVVGKNLADVRLILRRALIWLSIGVSGIAFYIGVLKALNIILRNDLSAVSVLASTMASFLAILTIYRLRGLFPRLMGKAFQGESFYYRQKLKEYSEKIHTIFSLKEQGGELLNLFISAVGCKKAGLLFPDAVSGDFSIQFLEPGDKTNSLSKIMIKKDNPIARYLKRHGAPLTRENIAILPEFMGLWRQEKEILETNQIELFIPLISRYNLIGILILDKKRSGRYSLEDLALLQDITSRISVSMEKEYLTQQLKQREEELSIINRASTIFTSSLDIQEIYNSFISELRKVLEVDWAAVGVKEGQEIYLMAVFSEIGSPWRVGERIPLKGTTIEWVVAQQINYIDQALDSEVQYDAGKYLFQHGIRSMVYQPLMVMNEVIGIFMVASRKPDAYNQQHLNLLEQLAVQIARPIENARVYAKTERMARVDELTGLLNRRSLDEILPNEIGRHTRFGGIFSFIIIDVDSLKNINDRYGHLAGDELLREIGNVMKNTIRDTDQAFRHGGDEFAILLPQTSKDTAVKVAERVRQQVSLRVLIGSTPITVSLGVASWPVDGVSSKDLVAAADTALYKAKKLGGNTSQSVSNAPLDSKDASTSASSFQNSLALSTIYALAVTVDARGYRNCIHSKQVHDLALAIGEGLQMNQLDLNRLGTCALLHDIGKIGINDEILNKESDLTDQEWQAIRSHPQLGAAIISHSPQLAHCISGVLYHHEKFNGEGYPEGLKGDEIPLESRILAIADSFAAMTSEKSYSKALSFDKALEEIKNGSGTQFDPELVKIFIKVIHKNIPTSGFNT